MVQSYIWFNMMRAACLKKAMVELNAFLVYFADPRGENARLRNRDAQAVNSESLAKLEILLVAIIEIAGRVS